MDNVIVVPSWGRNPNSPDIIEKYVSCDKFIRSKIVPPPLGTVMFNFAGGKVQVTGDTTTIAGGDCEIVIRGNFVRINGCVNNAHEMFCSIHREIEDIRGNDPDRLEATG